MATQRIGTAILEFKTDASGINAGVAQIQKDVGGLHSTLKGVGTALAASFSVDALAGVARQVMDRTSEIADATSRMGVSSAEAAQKLKFAAEQGGATVDDVGRAIKTMAGHLNDPSKGALAAFAELGLKVDDLKKMAPEDALTAIADAVAKVPGPMKQSVLATELLGKSGVNLLPAVKAGLTEIGNQAPVMSNAVVKAGDDMGDSWAKTQEQINVLKAQALTPLLETFVSMPQSAQIAIGGLAQLAPAFGTIMPAVMAAGGPIAAFKSVGAGLSLLFTGPAAPFILAGIAIAALVTLVVTHWDEIKAATKALVDAVSGWFSSTWEGVKTVTSSFVTSIREAFGRLGDFFKQYWPALLGPAGLMFVAWKKWGDDVTRIVQNFYGAVKEWLVDKFGAIVDAVKAKVEAVTGFFRDMYDKVVGHSYVVDMVDGIAAHFGRLPDVMVRPSEEATRAAADAFRGMATRATDSVTGMVGQLAELFGPEVSGIFDRYVAGPLGSLLGETRGAFEEDMPGTFSMFEKGPLSDVFNSLSETFGPKVREVMGKFQQYMRDGFKVVSGIARAFAGDFSGVVDAIVGGFNLVKGLADKLRGGEEGIVVNPARDKFSEQLRTRFGGANNFDGLVNALAAAGVHGSDAEALIGQMQQADSVQLWKAAQQAFIDALERGGITGIQSFHTGGMVPGWGEMSARLLGGERILSRVETDAYNRDLMAVPRGLLHARNDNAAQLAEVKKEIAGLRASMERDNRELPFLLTNAIKSALALA